MPASRIHMRQGGIQSRRETAGRLPAPERHLSAADPVLARLIAGQVDRWPVVATEDPISGLVRIVMAQQVSTRVACGLAKRVSETYPGVRLEQRMPDAEAFLTLGLPRRRAECCAAVIARADCLRASVARGESWQSALTGIKGIGPWTISVFRIMVVREPDVLPVNDLGLHRAIASTYGPDAQLEQLSIKWCPYRSVACWYLWRTLGNEQLG